MFGSFDQRGLTRVALVLIVGVCVACAGYGFLAVFSHLKLNSALEHWGQAFGPIAGIPFEQPRTEANTVALALEVEAAALGIGLAPEKSKRPNQESSLCVNDELRSWLRAELDSPSAAIGAPTPKLAAWLEANGPSIDALADRIRSGDVPRWESEVGADFLQLNWSGIFTLARTLDAAALASSSAGRDDRASTLLDAAWRLNESMRQSPALLFWAFEVGNARLTAGVLRKLPQVAPGWEERLSGLDLRRRVQDSLRWESRYVLAAPERYKSTDRWGNPATAWSRCWLIAGRPLLDVDLGRNLDDFRRAITEDARRLPCAADLAMLRMEEGRTGPVPSFSFPQTGDWSGGGARLSAVLGNAARA